MKNIAKLFKGYEIKRLSLVDGISIQLDLLYPNSKWSLYENQGSTLDKHFSELVVRKDIPHQLSGNSAVFPKQQPTFLVYLFQVPHYSTNRSVTVNNWCAYNITLL